MSLVTIANQGMRLKCHFSRIALKVCPYNFALIVHFNACTLAHTVFRLSFPCVCPLCWLSVHTWVACPNKVCGEHWVECNHQRWTLCNDYFLLHLAVCSIKHSKHKNWQRGRMIADGSDTITAALFYWSPIMFLLRSQPLLLINIRINVNLFLVKKM